MIAFDELASITGEIKEIEWACHFTPEQKQNMFSACTTDIPVASN